MGQTVLQADVQQAENGLEAGSRLQRIAAVERRGHGHIGSVDAGGFGQALGQVRREQRGVARHRQQPGRWQCSIPARKPASGPEKSVCASGHTGAPKFGRCPDGGWH